MAKTNQPNLVCLVDVKPAEAPAQIGNEQVPLHAPPIADNWPYLPDGKVLPYDGIRRDRPACDEHLPETLRRAWPVKGSYNPAPKSP